MSTTKKVLTWEEHTKKFAKKNKITYKDALSNIDNRQSYYDSQIDKSKHKLTLKCLKTDDIFLNLTKEQQQVKDEIVIQIKRSLAGKSFDLVKKTTENKEDVKKKPKKEMKESK